MTTTIGITRDGSPEGLRYGKLSVLFRPGANDEGWLSTTVTLTVTPDVDYRLSPIVLLFRDSLQSSCFVDDALEQPPHRAVIERSTVHALHVIEHFGLPVRLVDGHARCLFLASDGQRALGALAQQAHELLVDVVDPAAQRVERRHSALFSHRTYSPARSGALPPASAMTLTRALPTTAASANPHASPTERKLQAGDLLVIDWGAAYEGYISDLTRTFAVGEVDDEYKKIHKIVQEATAAGRLAAKPAVPCANVDKAARDVIEKSGYGKYFTHRTGHGIGMEGHEEPYMRGDNMQLLEPGMAFTVEPGIYLPDRNGVRIEDNVVITEDGADVLSDMPREIRVVG